LNSLRLPKGWEQIRCDSVWGKLLDFDVVELRSFSSADFIAIAEEFRMFCVVVPHSESLSEQLTEKREGSQGGNQSDLERVPE
jgi:hypothetical protein